MFRLILTVFFMTFFIFFSCEKKQKEQETRAVLGELCSINLYDEGTEELYEKIFNKLNDINNNVDISSSYKNNISAFPQVDFNKAVRGYATEEVIKFLKQNEIKNATVNIGSCVYVFGKKKDMSLWKIGIKNPINPNGTPIISLTGLQDVSIATSANYEKSQSVTVICKDSILADALSQTILSELNGNNSLLKKLSSISQKQSLSFILIKQNGIIYASKNLEGYLSLMLNDYSINFSI